MTTPRDPLDMLADDPTAEGEAAAAAGATGLPLEPDTSAIARLEQELAELRDRHVRLAAEFDNFRKRSARERAELSDRAQASLVGRLLEVLDDLQRAVTSEAESTPAHALRGALNAIDQKIRKELQAAGLECLDPVGAAFDPTFQEAVTMVPASSPEQDGTVASTLQAGYRFKGLLVRPARVAVFTMQGSA